jgi:signal peptidase II
LKGKFRSYTWLAVIAWVVVIADRVTKIVVERRYGIGYGPRPLVDHVLYLTVLRNSGAAFGLLQNFTAGFLVISLLVMAAILIYYPRIPRYDWPARIGLAMVFGGAVSNAYDRGLQGSVIDFIQIPHWPVFNVADSSITVGVALLVVGSFLRRRDTSVP